MNHRPELGRWGERQAAAHLRRAGYGIVETNARTRLGEIDIVARDGLCLVFVEVRSKESVQFAPEESVGKVKQRRLSALGQEYLQRHGLADAEWRVDVIAIERGPGGELARLEHYVNAVEEPD